MRWRGYDAMSGRNRPSSIGVRDMLSYQSLMPAGAGTRRYENWGCWLGQALECHLGATPGFRPRIGVRGMLAIAGMTIGGPE